MSVETDFLLALVEADDRLGEQAATRYGEHRLETWTSAPTLVELLPVAYREGLDPERVVANAKGLVETRGDAKVVLAAASHVAESDLPPFEALYLDRSGDDPMVSSDEAYEGLTDRIPIRPDE